MMDFTEEMVEQVALAVNGTTELEIWGQQVSFRRPFRRITMTDAIREKTGFDITGKSEEELREACRRLHVETDETMGKGKADRRPLRRILRTRPHSAHFRHGLPHRDVAAGETPPQQSRPDGTVRTLRGRQGALQRLLRTQRPDRPARPLPGAAPAEREGRRRGDVHRHGLCPRPRIRHAPHLGYGHGHRPPDDVHDQPALHSGRPALSANETRKGRRPRQSGEVCRKKAFRRNGCRYCTKWDS